VSVKFSCVLFTVLDFWTFKDGPNRYKTTTLHCVIYWNSADLTLPFVDTGLGLTPDGPVQNGSVWRFTHKFR